MKTKQLLSLLIFLLCWTIPAQTQVDTSLTYADFLNDCRNFTRNPQDEVWVVNFWGSYNQESLLLIPSIIESMERYRNKPVRFIGISTDSRRRNWEGVLNRYNLDGEQLWLPDKDDYDFLKLAFQHKRLPAIFVVEQTGQIRRVKLDDLYALVDALCEDLPNEPYYQQDFTNDNDAQSGGRDMSSGDEYPDEDGNGTWINHTVRKGDTLYGIYKRYNVSVDQLKRINGLRGNTIKVGQVLKIKRR